MIFHRGRIWFMYRSDRKIRPDSPALRVCTLEKGGV